MLVGANRLYRIKNPKYIKIIHFMKIKVLALLDLGDKHQFNINNLHLQNKSNNNKGEATN